MNNEHVRNSTPTFIDHKPIGDDLFEGQPQKRISYSISKLIKLNQIEVKLIGLDGPWGAGKSNLVKMVAENLEDSHHVFYFDAWGHQEDLQRRAFLEELTADLSDNELIEKQKWQDRVKSLLSRKRETTTKTIPKISNGVIVTIIVLLLTPITVEIAQLIDNFLWAIFISVLPIISGFLAYIYASCKENRLYTLHELYSIYSDQQASSDTHTVISEREPTVREFQEWMNELSEALDNNKKLIIVFDNMDRLPSDKVRQMWSSIHTFFSEEYYENIWVIIPFDRMHLKDTFRDNGSLTLDQFFAKTFSVIYRVALPVLTDWQGYFNLRFREAFKESEVEEFDFVRKIFVSFQVDITPRKIISFINELVALRLTMEERIPLRYIALFVLAKGEILADPVANILGKQFLGNSSRLFKNDQDLQDYIAALVYNVPVSLASQVTLTKEIRTSLDGGDSLRLSVLTDHVHFSDILEQVVAESYFDVSNACSALSILLAKPGKLKCSDIQLQRIWDGLCYLKLQESHNEIEFTEPHKILMSNVSKNSMKALVKFILDSIRNVEQFDGAEYFYTMKAVEDHSREVSEDFEFKSLVQRKTVSPEVFIDYLSVARDSYLDYGLDYDEELLLEYVKNRIPDQLEGFDVISVLKNKKLNKLLEDSLVSCIENDTITADNFTPFFKLYRMVATKTPVQYLNVEKVVEFFPSVEVGSEAELELLAMRFAHGGSISPQGGRFDDITEEVDEARIAQIAEIIEYYSDLGDLLIDCVNWHPEGFKELVSNLIMKCDGPSRLSITDVLSCFTEILEVLEIDPEVFLNQLNSWSEFAKKEITPQNVSDIILDQEFFRIAANSECELSKHIVNMMVIYLEAVDREAWYNSFRESDPYLLAVSMQLLKDKQLRNVPKNAILELKLVLSEIAQGIIVWNSKGVLELFYQRTHKNRLKATAKEIRDMFIRERNITPQIFLLLSDLLFDCAALDEKSSDSIRGILSPVLENDECLRIFMEHTPKIVSLIKNAGVDAENFVESVKDYLQSNDDNTDFGGFRNAVVEAAMDR